MRPTDELLLALPQVVAPVVEHWQPEPLSCVLNCKVALDALARFGVKAAPLCVDVGAFNAQAWRLYNADVPVDQWPADAYSIGTDAGLPVDPANGKWSGYLVLIAGDRLIDVSLDQLSRPAYGIVLEPRTVGFQTGWGKDGDQLGVEIPPRGVMVKYVVNATADTWRRAPDWQDSDLAAHCSGNVVSVLTDWGFAVAG